MGRGNAEKVAVLSVHQMEQILILMKLHQPVERVIICQRFGNGHVPETFVRLYGTGTQTYRELDITDNENW